MTQPADLAHDVLIRVAELLRRLPAQDLADLASGEAKLEVVPKGGRRVPAAEAAANDALPRPATEIADTMTAIGGRAGVRQYLTDLKLTVPKLKALAAELGVTVRGTRKDPILDAIVEWAVGRRVDSDVMTRVGTF